MNKKSAVPVFFCIPDITGFTRFVTTTDDADFANRVISTVLNKVAEANILAMDIAEIEGDAIFFFKIGRLPAIKKVAQQCQLIYEVFLDAISGFEQTDPDLYHKYLSANQLGMKVIVHHGQVTPTKIGKRTKLMGEDVILAHKLLKNSVVDPCYILLTQKYLAKLKDKKVVKTWFNWDRLKHGKDEYEHFGIVEYAYISLPDCKPLSKSK